MKAIFFVAVGGAIGSVARYKLSGWILHHTVDWRFPAGTVAVNVLGCLAAGLLAGLAQKQDLLDPDTRIFLFSGLLGGFTTFSAFGLETMHLFKRGEPGIAALNVAVSVAAGLLALWLGMALAPQGGR